MKNGTISDRSGRSSIVAAVPVFFTLGSTNTFAWSLGEAAAPY